MANGEWAGFLVWATIAAIFHISSKMALMFSHLLCLALALMDAKLLPQPQPSQSQPSPAQLGPGTGWLDKSIENWQLWLNGAYFLDICAGVCVCNIYTYMYVYIDVYVCVDFMHISVLDFSPLRAAFGNWILAFIWGLLPAAAPAAFTSLLFFVLGFGSLLALTKFTHARG